MGRRAVFVVIAAALLFTGAAEAARPAPAATGDLAWTDCGDGFECAKLAVPYFEADPFTEAGLR